MGSNVWEGLRKADAEVFFVKWRHCAFSFQTGCQLEEKRHGSVHSLRPEIVHGGIMLKNKISSLFFSLLIYKFYFLKARITGTP